MFGGPLWTVTGLLFEKKLISAFQQLLISRQLSEKGYIVNGTPHFYDGQLPHQQLSYHRR
jgi:hypothetical protein